MWKGTVKKIDGVIVVKNPIFPRCYWAITNEDNLVWGFADKYKLFINNSEGKPIKKITKEYDPIKITDEEKASSTPSRKTKRDTSS